MPTASTTTTTKPLTSRQQQALATKARIADAALRLFSQQGYAATSTKQIAQEAGVSEGLIFRYFPTKQELLHSLSKMRRTFSGEVRSLLEDACDRPATESLPAIAAGFVEVVREETPFLNMLFGESRTDDELYAMFAGIVATTSDTLASYLDARVEAGELRADLDTASAARAFFGPLILFFLTHKHLSDDDWAEAARSYVEGVLDLWFRGAQRDG